MGKCGRRGEHPHARRIARAQIRTSPNPDEPKSGREARGARRERACTGIGREVTLDILGSYAALDGHAAHTDAILQATAGGADGRSVRRERSKAIRGHQRSSEVVGCKQGLLACTSPIRCNQMQSVVIRGHQRSSEAPRLHEPNVFERGARCDPKLSLHEIDAGHLLRHCVLHLRASGAIRGHQWHQRPSEAIRSHRRPSEAIRGNQRQSEAIRHLDTWVDLDEVIAPLCVH